MIKNSTQLWIEAGKILAENPEKEVSCPECGSSYLLVKDVFNDKNENQMERYLICETCDLFNVIRMVDNKKIDN